MSRDQCIPATSFLIAYTISRALNRRRERGGDAFEAIGLDSSNKSHVLLPHVFAFHCAQVVRIHPDNGGLSKGNHNICPALADVVEVLWCKQDKVRQLVADSRW